MSKPRIDSNLPVGPQQASGDFIAHIGKLPRLAKGQSVWILIGGNWHIAEVQSRLPGDVYWTRLPEAVSGCKRFVVHVGNFGGPWQA